MDDERQVRPGFLPPKAPGAGAPPRFQAPEPPQGLTPAAPAAPAEPATERPAFVAQKMESGPSSAVAITGTALGAISILLLFVSIGTGYQISLVFSLLALGFGLLARKQITERKVGRAGQARAAIWVASIGLGLAIIAMIVWLSLEASGYTQAEFLESLRDKVEELEERSRERDGS